MTEPRINEDGKYLCLIDGAVLEPTPEEAVRQRFIATLIDDYGYSVKLLRREVPIYHGSSELSDGTGRPIRADIIAYRTIAAAASRDQGQVKFVVECKKRDETAGYSQLVSYIFNTNAPGGVWTNGNDTTFFRVDRDSNSLLAFPELPRANEEWAGLSERRKTDLEQPSDIRRLFRTCNNKLYGRGMENSDYDLTMDMVRILLAKIQDESEPGELTRFHVTPREYETTEGKQTAATRVRDLFNSFADQYRAIFPEGEKIEVPDTAIVEVVAVLQPWSLVASYDKADDWDIMGAAYEQYTHQNLKRQRGQFFTNRLVVDMMVKMINPTVGEKVLDPAGGSGGFVTAAFRHLRRLVLNSTNSSSPQRERQLGTIKEQLYLAEISPRLVKLAKTAMLLNGDGHAGMTRANSLGPYDEMDDWLRARCRRHEPGVILTNPPFAGQGDSRIDDPTILADFELAKKFTLENDVAVSSPDLMPSQAPEILFFERCLDWLKPGGRMAIVMPKSFLDTTQALQARQLMFANARLDAVITLHKNSFQPDTGVRTCVLFITKNVSETQDHGDYDIYLASSQKVGQDSEGEPIFQVGSDGLLTNQLDEDLTEIRDDYERFHLGELKASQYRYSVKRSEITNRLNINPQYYSPHLNESISQIRRFDDLPGWSVTTIGQIEPGVKIFKGPRLKTENVIVSGPDGQADVVGYFTPSAMLQDKRDSAKWINRDRANQRQLRDFDVVTVREGDLLLTRSGAIGRLAYVSSTMHNQIVSDDMIRVRVPSSAIRAYVAAFLLSENAASQMLRNEYGAIQQHLEPNHVRDLLIPIPDEWEGAASLIREGQAFISSKEQADRAVLRIRNAGFDSGIAELLDEATGSTS